ncbi:helix-turn-helix domain-containing protein [Frigidibacter albus]|uniref:Helix-turn-helix domain-containing protein n=1 Tax=Frigidibacter albus TaxID=1465486 RepID=A0A6L8VE55_9RHOB|nr:AraC family transcriptional regulator [Frigidibacter albus]MZQ87609.1 helix-turn-helix domain-containing protein [Frigidibacter albus]NBE29515.1 helix-turn-helix domain-containing protein [Frigidibacter albus]GGH44379.1 transcriptional regulator [Frigidibacter albus]
MNHEHEFVGQTNGITLTAPVRWQRLDGAVGVFWQAEGARGARGYYLSNHPRISVFFNDMSGVRVSNDAVPEDTHLLASDRTAEGRGLLPVAQGAAGHGRPMARVLFVPAGLPMWTLFTSGHAFSHLDIHLHPSRLVKMLSPALGKPGAIRVLGRPVECEGNQAIDALATLLTDEIRTRARHALFAESLVDSLVAGLLDIGVGARVGEPDRAEPRLTRGQMRKLVTCFRARGGRRLTIAEMSAEVGLSESWFSHLFKNTTGTTPLQWQLRQRVELAQDLLGSSGLSLAEIAGRLGFTDQAHLTKVFRRVTGETPAAWRRTHPAGAPAASDPPQRKA